MSSAGPTGATPTVAIANIGRIVSGDWRNPFVDGDDPLRERQDQPRRRRFGGGGRRRRCRDRRRGVTAAPGLIDSHVHVTFGDYTPRQKTVGYLESYLHGGVTTAISASEVHVPGRPSDAAGVKALAVAARKSFERFAPGACGCMRDRLSSSLA